jgi:hypothetical protein
MAKKTVWAEVSIELDWEHDVDDEVLMDYTSQVLVEAGVIVDDMGMKEEGAPAPAPAPVAKGMDIYERVACAEYLSAFPDNVTFKEVMEMLLDRNDEVLVWEAFDREHPSNVYEFICNLRELLERTFIPREEAK